MWLHVVWQVVLGNVTFQTDLILGNTSVRTSNLVPSTSLYLHVCMCSHAWTHAHMNMNKNSTHRIILGNWLNLLHLVLTPETNEMCTLKKQSSAKVSLTMSKLQLGIKCCTTENGVGPGQVTYYIQLLQLNFLALVRALFDWNIHCKKFPHQTKIIYI